MAYAFLYLNNMNETINIEWWKFTWQLCEHFEIGVVLMVVVQYMCK